MIIKSVVLRCGIERAFDLFTLHASEWWPGDRRHTRDPASVIRMEATGRFYERTTDGTEVDLGIIRVYEPLRRLLIDWYPGTSQNEPTEVEVKFEPADAGTRVTITHGPGRAGIDLYSRAAPKYDRAWESVLAAFEHRAQAEG